MKQKHVIVYEGINVSLGILQSGYLVDIFAGINDLEVTRGVIVRPPISFEAERDWFEKQKNSQTDHVFAILLNEPKSKHRFIGLAGLHQITWPDGFAKTGSIIYDRGAHGKGYGTEAKLLLLYHAFLIKGLRKVMSEVKAFNGNSFGHLVKCGYKVIGRHRRHHFDQGTYVDSIMLEVFRSDFEQVWVKYRDTKKLPQLNAEERQMLTTEMDI